MGKVGNAWKELEKKVAKVLHGERVLRGSDFSESDVDVKVPDFAWYAIDCKSRARHAHHRLMEGIREKYCKNGRIPVLITKEKGKQGEYVTLPLKAFGDILNTIRMRDALERIVNG